MPLAQYRKQAFDHFICHLLLLRLHEPLKCFMFLEKCITLIDTLPQLVSGQLHLLSTAHGVLREGVCSLVRTKLSVMVCELLWYIEL